MSNLIIKKLAEELERLGYPDVSSKLDHLSESFEDRYSEEIEEFGSEPISEREYLRENISARPPDENSPIPADLQMRMYHKILDDIGFEPVQLTNFCSIEIGKGCYGTVFSGIYDGKDAAVKIDLEPEQSTEIQAWQKIIDIKQNLPEKFKKYIPGIYALVKNKKINLGGQEDPDKDLNYSAVIMERLYPSDKNILSLLKIDKDGHLGIVTDSFTSFSGWAKVSDAIYNRLTRGYYNKDFSYKKIVSKEHFKNLYPIDIDIKSKEQLASALAQKIQKLILADGKFYYQKFRGDRDAYLEFSHNLLEDVTLDIMSCFKNFKANLEYFPINYDDFNQEEYNEYGELEPGFNKRIWGEEPNLRGLYEFLSYLAERHNIIFQDMHDKNIMQNLDGDFKIIDLGLWDFPM